MEDMNDSVEESFLDEFIEEAKEHLENIEIKILELERDMNNKEIINSIFRNMHTLKGIAGFVAQEEIEIVAHKSENILSGIRKNEFPSSKRIIDLILASIDYIRSICNDIKIVKSDTFKKEFNSHIELLDSFKSVNP